MRTLNAIFAFAALLALSSPATAADPYYAGSTKDSPVAASSQHNWSGFYVGVNAGAGWSQLDSSYYASGDCDGRCDLTINHTNADLGAVGGGQAGYNFQTGAFVLGLEGDVGYLGVSQTRNIISAHFGSDSLALGTKIDSGLLADITARVGYASGPALFYVKGGWAYFDGSVGTSGIAVLAPGYLRDVSASGLSGWTIGGGIEYLLSPSWSVKAEYQHFDFGSVDFHPVISDPTQVIHNDLTTEVVKIGVSYHFGAIK